MDSTKHETPAPASPESPAENAGETPDLNWVQWRLRRHLTELLRLSAPAMATRLGILALGFVDTVMVSRYATAELAWLSLANRSVISFLLVVAIGLLMGVIVCTASAYGRGDEAECGRVWRRSMPYALWIGGIMLLLSLPAHFWMRLLAADPVIAAQSADLVIILGLGLPAHLIFFCCTGFLEGIRKPIIPMLALIGANGVNVFLNYGLIYGHYGFPELGAAGSAITSTSVRWVLAFMLLGYLWYAPAMQRFGLRRPHGLSWRDWAHQRTIGYASAVSIGAEVGAFSGLVVIAEKLGALSLAGQEIVFNVLSLPFMVAVGIGSATAVRVGISHGRGDPLDTALAGWTGLFLSFLLMAAAALVILAVPEWIYALHSDDKLLAAITIPAIIFVAYVTIFDGGQAVISMGLRGLGETWWPTAIQGVAYLGLMLPLSWFLAVEWDRGLIGLLEATLIASIFSVIVQSIRFWWLTGREKAFESSAG
ncbi:MULTISPECIES: MATE family efflux transporter [unclassified Iodidimonas]|jgi:MATE family multidrug resistance protein|uniref:MATE family efflux transporter n=1 Tax=unclassified Iodidimonas TaxID=2626145 RepID=UPI0024823B88|nr:MULTISPECIES: MATE family efflux transporter [unclassified Iodidimonas]